MTQQLTVGSLFSGIGGLDLGLERAGMRVLWQVEIDPYAQQVLAKHWPAVTRYGDICRVSGDQVAPVDVLAGGFPCQDISNAGQRAGIGGTRSGLWAEYYRLICELRPRYVVVENVAALLNRGLDRVLGDLAAGGYDAEWTVLSACQFGAPHTRERVFVVAYPTGGQSRQLRGFQCPPRRETTRYLSWAQTEPGIHRVADGVPARLDRLRGLGNAVVPQVAEFVGRCIVAHAGQS